MVLPTHAQVELQKVDLQPEDIIASDRTKTSELLLLAMHEHQASESFQFPSYEQIPSHIDPAICVTINAGDAALEDHIVHHHLEAQNHTAFDSKSPFRTCREVPSVTQIMDGTVTTSSISTCFPNLRAAKTYIKRSIPQSDEYDPTIPITNEQHRALVGILSATIQSTALAEDNPDYILSFERKYHNILIVEYCCWKLLKMLKRRAQAGMPLLIVFSATGEQPSSRSKSKGIYKNFAHLFDATVYTLLRKKSVCAQIIDATPAIKLADDPIGRHSKSIENQHVNEQKRKDINLGRQHRVAAGEAEPPKKRNRKAASASIVKQRKPSYSTRSRTPPRAHPQEHNLDRVTTPRGSSDESSFLDGSATSWDGTVPGPQTTASLPFINRSQFWVDSSPNNNEPGLQFSQSCESNSSNMLTYNPQTDYDFALSAYANDYQYAFPTTFAARGTTYTTPDQSINLSAPNSFVTPLPTRSIPESISRSVMADFTHSADQLNNAYFAYDFCDPAQLHYEDENIFGDFLMQYPPEL